jgi:hypothetical protein
MEATNEFMMPITSLFHAAIMARYPVVLSARWSEESCGGWICSAREAAQALEKPRKTLTFELQTAACKLISLQYQGWSPFESSDDIPVSRKIIWRTKTMMNLSNQAAFVMSLAGDLYVRFSSPDMTDDFGSPLDPAHWHSKPYGR